MNDRRCEVCEGRGTIRRLVAREPVEQSCPKCGGSGWKPSPGDALPPIPKQPWGPDLTPKPKPMNLVGPRPHFHRNTLGVLEACYHRITPKGWATGLLLWTISFPFEHLLWERAPLFSDITRWLGL